MKFYPDIPEKIDHLEHFSLKKDFSFNVRNIYLIGGRRYGKTFSVKHWLIDQFIKYGKTFMWVRSTDKAIEELDTLGFFSRIAEFLPEWGVKEYSIKKQRIYLNGKYAGRIFAISTFYNKKGADFKIDNAVWDEFMRAKGERSLSGKREMFNDLCESVLRDSNGKKFYLSNSTNAYDEVLAPFKLTFKQGFGCYLFREQNAVIHYIRSSERHIQNMEKSMSGEVMDEEEKDMAFNNKFSDAGEYGKETKTRYMLTLQISDTKFISFYQGSTATYVKPNFPNNPVIFAIENHYVNSRVKKLTPSARKLLQSSYNRGSMVFIDGYCRSSFIETVM